MRAYIPKALISALIGPKLAQNWAKLANQNYPVSQHVGYKRGAEAGLVRRMKARA